MSGTRELPDAPKTAGPDRQFGEFGEQEVAHRLTRALLGDAKQYAGFADKGLDLLVQFPSTAPSAQPLHFGVQVKTGDSFVVEEEGAWRVRGVDERRFREWQRGTLPVLFVWVRPDPCECYWAVVRKGTSFKHFKISKHALVTPAMRFDLSLEQPLEPPVVSDQAFRPLRPRLSEGLRPFAKRHYRDGLMSWQPDHPVLGKVRFSWRGWRHLTRKGRSQDEIYHSLQLLDSASWLTGNPQTYAGIRRLGVAERGGIVTDTRLVIYDTDNVPFERRPPARIRTVFRQRISYPANWTQDVSLHKHVTSDVTFESLYEKWGKADNGAVAPALRVL